MNTYIPSHQQFTEKQINDLLGSLEAPMRNIDRRIANACVVPMFAGLGLAGVAILYVKCGKDISLGASVSALVKNSLFGSVLY